MYGFIKKTFILVLVLLGFGRPLATKCVSINNQAYMVKVTFIDMDPNELCY